MGNYFCWCRGRVLPLLSFSPVTLHTRWLLCSCLLPFPSLPFPSCLNNVIQAKGPLIRSGWKTVLTVLRLAAGDKEEEVGRRRFLLP